MRSSPACSRTRRLSCAWVLALLWGCSLGEPTGPDLRQDPASGAEMSSAPAYDPAKLVPAGSSTVPIPADNGPPTYGGVGRQSAGVMIEQPTWVRIRVQGELTLGVTPGYASIYCQTQQDIDGGRCTKLRGQKVGPMGVGYSWQHALQVWAYVGGVQVALAPVGDDPSMVEGIIYGSGEVEVARKQFYLLYNCPEICEPVLTFSGEQTVTIDTLPVAPSCPAPSFSMAGGASASTTSSSSTCEDEKKPELVLECNGSRSSVSVERGGTIDCTAKVEPAGAELHVKAWNFRDEQGHTIPGPTGGNTTWNGPVAVGGIVAVEAVVDGEEAGESLNVEVKPRKWARLRPRFYDGGHGDLPEPENVIAVPQLAHVHVDPPESYEVKKIEEGPNAGWWFLLGELGEIPVPMHVNTAFQRGSAWYRLQRGGPHRDANGRIDGRYCRGSDIPAIEQSAREHEGFAESEHRSHMDVFADFFRNNDLQVEMEKVVAFDSDLGGQEFKDVLAGAFGVHVRGRAHSDPAQRHTNHNGEVWVPIWPCYLRFF